MTQNAKMHYVFGWLTVLFLLFSTVCFAETIDEKGKHPPVYPTYYDARRYIHMDSRDSRYANTVQAAGILTPLILTSMPNEYRDAKVVVSKTYWADLSRKTGPDSRVVATYDEKLKLVGFSFVEVLKDGFFWGMGVRNGDQIFGVSGAPLGSEEKDPQMWGINKSQWDFFPKGRVPELFLKRGKEFLRIQFVIPKK